MAARSTVPGFWPTEGEKRMTSARVTTMQTLNAEIARLQAKQFGILAAEWESIQGQTSRVGSTESKLRDLPLRSAAAEYATAGRVSDTSMQATLERCGRIASELPTVLTAFGEGLLSQPHVLVIAEVGRRITDPEQRAQFEELALSYASRMTPGQLRNALTLAADRMLPTSMAERHQVARAQRAVRVGDLEDGMSELYAILPTVLAHGIHDRLTRQAKEIKTQAARDAAEAQEAGLGDLRTIDQIRADLFADVLLTATPGADATHGNGDGALGAIRATVHVTAPALTLLGADDGAAELAGKAPIDPETARRLAGNNPDWVRLLVHPVSGMVVAVDRYRASAEMERFLDARDRHCRFPGCRMPARRCDLDHNKDFAHGGKTDICNLCHLCKRHHILKHETPWTMRQLAGGLIEWTSPTGRVYIDLPEPTLTFTTTEPEPEPDEEPAPF